MFGLSEELPEKDKVIIFKTIDERVVDGVYISVPVEIHFTLSVVEDNRIKQILVHVIDADLDSGAEQHDDKTENLKLKEKETQKEKSKKK